VLDFIARGTIDATGFDRALAPGRLIYPDQGVHAQMNLLGSHDTERFRTIAGGSVDRLKLAAVFGMTYVGAPTIYYGDEIGMEGGGDPDCRRTFRWTWQSEPERVETHDHFRRLADIRHDHELFSMGGFETILSDGRTYAYRRFLGDEVAYVVLNSDEEPVTVELPVVADHGSVHDALNERNLPVVVAGDGDATVTVRLDGLSGAVLIPPGRE
jgi:glycosidase